MAKILKMPVKAPSKFGYRRAKKKRLTDPEKKDQLNLFLKSNPNILNLQVDLTPFEQALILDERGDHQAGEAYARAISAGDSIADAYCNLGIIESREARSAKAFDCFTQALKNEPRHFESHYNLANLYFDLGDLRLAQVHYELAAELAPKFPNIYFNLGLVQTINKDFNAAEVALERYRQLVSEGEGREAQRVLSSLKRKLAGH